MSKARCCAVLAWSLSACGQVPDGIVSGGTETCRHEPLTAVVGYMTAPEMQAKVQSLTGVLHPGFDRHADVLGRFDSRTGQRTVSAPSLLSILVLQQLATEVAEQVVERETFLDNDERVVWRGVDLQTVPDDAALAEQVQILHLRWLGKPAGAATAALLMRYFRTGQQDAGPAAGYARLLEMLLQHGALYYY